jgi:dihydroneopterin triphosphate diphosphatase
MPRQPFQVLIFPYRLTPNGNVRYAVFRRSDLGAWQGLAGGGEGDETPEAAARREALEEAGIFQDLLRLNTVGRVSVDHFPDRVSWDPELNEIPEYGFAVEVTSDRLALSDEHSQYAWLDFDAALHRLEWDTNRALLRELHHRLTGVTS